MVKLQHDLQLHQKLFIEGKKKSMVFTKSKRDGGFLLCFVFSNYIWICIWIYVIEISLQEKPHIWNRCWLQLYCCNLWNQLITSDFVSLRICNILYMVIHKMEINHLISWSFSVLFSLRIQKYTNDTLFLLERTHCR